MNKLEVKSSDVAVAAISKDNTIHGTNIPIGVGASKESISKLVEMVKITPELADKYIQSQDNNRPVNLTNLTYLMNELRLDKWGMTGEAIKFDVNGFLRDGQHRCHAIINSGITAEFMVMGGIDPNTFDIMDTGKSRTIGDIFQIAGFSNAKQLGTIIVQLMRLEYNYYDGDTLLPKTFPDNRTARQYAEEHLKELEVDIETAVKKLKKVSNKNVVPQTIFVSMWIYLQRRGKGQATEFLESLVNYNCPDKSPELALYNWMDKCKDPKKDTTCSTIDMLHGYIYAYNCYVKGIPCSPNKLPQDESVVQFVRPIEVKI